MNFALSQRRTDRHPVGLLIVVGLHVLLAAALLSAKLVSPGAKQPPIVDMTPLDPEKPVEHKSEDLPKPLEPTIRTPIVPPPPFVIDQPPPPDTVIGRPDDHVKIDEPVIHEARLGQRDLPTRVTPRAAHINAGAAQCRPEYPAAAQRAGATGTTLIRFSVDATGRISGSQILQSSGATRENRMMDKAAAEALAQCPVQVGTDETGRPVGTTTDVQYVWSLN